ncbi:GNAT family N-acetyltransferase [Shewanella sp. A3A]|nr:GNAT family N-acetyltransferase [Shewanella ferrihydritica]
MLIRPLTDADLAAVSALCISAFEHSVAATVTPEGIATFNAIATSEALAERRLQDNVILVAEQQGELLGMIELKAGHHLSMLFVAPTQQHHGVGRQLLQAVLAHARAQTITVKSSLPAVGAYERYGFKATGAIAESAGLTYQPMLLTLTP